MQLLLHTAGISSPTIDSFYEYADMRFGALEKLISGPARLSANLTRIGTRYKQFELKVEFNENGRRYFARATRETISEVVDKVNKQLKRQLNNN